MSDASQPHGSHAHGPSDEFHVHAHVSSVRFYAGIFAALIVLTLLTVGISYVHLGPANLAVAVVIASIKATLVVLFFMHLKYDNRFNSVILICSLMFIGVFFAYTLNDTLHRGEMDESSTVDVDVATGKRAPGGLLVVPAAAPQKKSHH